MTRVDKILEILDGHEHQVAADPAYGVASEGCWRCKRKPVNELGACDGCTAWMRGESDDDPAENTTDEGHAAAWLRMIQSIGAPGGPGRWWR